ncbi:MAG: NifB/NifX family molybdenum-iron cluster-binding protein [Candidatus Kapabacteria bacterium]|nr:NifB/NifX family molybdenum-iron cluster-binding protein [Ignavibacteriota bacterium]MCW5885414.1 NifB/NifX family molybdenum-iron cluster-binding protein [Candidatus Kapabacteria bacterium]
MKICIPTAKDEGIDSVAYGHFGSSPYFMIYDLASKELYSIKNNDEFHQKGMCSPADTMKEHEVTAVIVGGMGAKALRNLAASGIKVYRSTTFFHVYDIIDQFQKNLLFELNPQDGCKEHDCENYE